MNRKCCQDERQDEKAVEISSRNVDVAKGKRSKQKEDGITMKEDTEEATPLSVTSRSCRSYLNSCCQNQGKETKKMHPSQLTSEDKQEKEEAFDIQVAAKKRRGKKGKEPVKVNVPAIEANGVSQPKAPVAEVKKERGRAKVVAFGEVEASPR